MLWYVRSKNKVIGPFPTGQIQQEILLGRIALEAEFSQDKDEWKSLRYCPQLIPKALKGDSSDEHHRERLAAARRWADERRYERRSGEDDPARKGPGRRTPEGIATLDYRDHREALVRDLRPGKERKALVIMTVILLLAAGGYAGFRWVPQTPTGPQCEATALAGVNWSQCNKAGLQLLNGDLSAAHLNSTNFAGAVLTGTRLFRADLSYADLSNSNLKDTNLQQASLKGANLRSADFTYANISNANLSYADLQNANLTGATLANADFSHAIWVDGKKCAVGSIGVCLTAK